MKQFDLYNPRSPLPQQVLLKKFISPQEEEGEDFYFVRHGDHLIGYYERIHVYPATSPRYGQKELRADQLEMPLSGVRWFIDVIEQKFFKPPSEGGLPADSISYREDVDGERLHVLRAVMAGCPHPGYDITNLNRRSHILDEDHQTLSLSDPWLFNRGLMDFLKEIADKYEQGTL